MSSVCYSRFKSYLKQLFIRNKLCSSSPISSAAADKFTPKGNPHQFLFMIFANITALVNSTLYFKIKEAKERIILQVCGHDLSQVFTNFLIFVEICPFLAANTSSKLLSACYLLNTVSFIQPVKL